MGSPYQNIPPDPDDELYIVTGKVIPAIHGEHEVEFATIQPNEAHAKKRFRWHFEQMGRRVVGRINVEVYEPGELGQ